MIKIKERNWLDILSFRNISKGGHQITKIGQSYWWVKSGSHTICSQKVFDLVKLVENGYQKNKA